MFQVNEGVREKENSDRLEWIQAHVQCEGLSEVQSAQQTRDQLLTGNHHRKPPVIFTQVRSTSFPAKLILKSSLWILQTCVELFFF